MHGSTVCRQSRQHLRQKTMLQVWCQIASMRMDPKWSLIIVSSFHELWDILQQINYYHIWETLLGCRPSCHITCCVLHSPAHVFFVHHKHYGHRRFVTLLRTLPTPHKTLAIGSAICFIREIIYIYIYYFYTHTHIRIHFKSWINSKVEIQKLHYKGGHLNHWLASLETCPTSRENMQIYHRGKIVFSPM